MTVFELVGAEPRRGDVVRLGRGSVGVIVDTPDGLGVLDTGLFVDVLDVTSYDDEDYTPLTLARPAPTA